MFAFQLKRRTKNFKIIFPEEITSHYFAHNKVGPLDFGFKLLGLSSFIIRKCKNFRCRHVFPTKGNLVVVLLDS